MCILYRKFEDISVIIFKYLRLVNLNNNVYLHILPEYILPGKNLVTSRTQSCTLLRQKIIKLLLNS